jgi:hypothetical protein
MGSSARLIRVVNTTHVTAEVDPWDCASRLVRQFVADPALLFGLNASCAGEIPGVRSVGAFSQQLSGEPTAQPQPGNRANMTGLRAATASAETAGDAIYRSSYLSVTIGTGLRGGTFSIATSATGSTTLTLAAVKWVNDLTVDGVVNWDPLSGAVSATLRLFGPGSDTGQVAITWDARVNNAPATVTGMFAGQPIVATLPAP